MKILGIDPGYGLTGWSVISNTLMIYEYGIIETSPSLSIDQRLYKIHRELSEIIEKHQPGQIAIEKLFFTKNSKTVIDVAKAIGVIAMTAGKYGLGLFEYTPTQIKFSISGYGKAPKKQIQLLTKKIFNIKEIPKPDDSADALAIALCHYLMSTSIKSNKRIQS